MSTTELDYQLAVMDDDGWGSAITGPVPVAKPAMDDTGRTGGPQHVYHGENGRWSMDPRLFEANGPWAVPDDTEQERAA